MKILDFFRIFLFEFISSVYFFSLSLLSYVPDFHFSLSFLLLPLGALFHFSFLIYTQSVGLLKRGISRAQSRYLRRTTQTQNKRRQTTMPEWDSNPRSQCQLSLASAVSCVSQTNAVCLPRGSVSADIVTAAWYGRWMMIITGPHVENYTKNYKTLKELNF
jgi:hypothetical protein